MANGKITVTSGRERQHRGGARSCGGAKRTACVICICGAIFCAAFFAAYLSSGEERYAEGENYTFDTVFASASSDGGNGRSVITGSMDNGEWSLWAYLEYVISRLIGG